MAFVLDLATDRGKVRMIVGDDVSEYEFFTDAKIDAFLTLAVDLDGNVVFNAAAMCLDTWATNQTLVLKKIKLLDISTDGPAVATAMREHATLLREQAAEASTDAGFDVAELALGTFSLREQLENALIRDA